MGLTAYNSNKAKKRFLMIISFYLINLSFIGSLVIFEIKDIQKAKTILQEWRNLQ